ncbi:MAG: nucleoside deaminase [Patescibacteria group bacterium]|nr:nucleoside deaminase [Patescibacteria group bacterium]
MNHISLMKKALLQARRALAKDEVPIGAIIFDVTENKIIGRGYNKKESANNPIAHAEIIAIQKACKNRKNWRLPNTILVSTVEPCAMCVGAIIQARIPHVIFGCSDKKFGALGSIVDLRDKKWNHKFEVESGILETECKKLLREFFAEMR